MLHQVMNYVPTYTPSYIQFNSAIGKMNGYKQKNFHIYKLVSVTKV